jgi:hypothetical protein
MEFPLLPDPVLRQDDKDHYKPFDEVLNTETQEGRPSAEIPKPRDNAEQLQVCMISEKRNMKFEKKEASILNSQY